jgi:hypothetical protein
MECCRSLLMSYVDGCIVAIDSVLLLLLLMTSSFVVVGINDHVGGSFFFFVLWCGVELNADLGNHSFTLPAALYFECWLDTELANTDKERSVVVVKGVLLLLSNSIQS